MPPANHAALASVGIIAVSVAVAAAIAVYELPEVRRRAEELRRRIAIAIQSLGDNFDANNREPRFNRPEDADGFMQSRGLKGEAGVEADEESRCRQRDELIYWNSLRQEKLARNSASGGEDPEKTGLSPSATPPGSAFTDSSHQDYTAGHGNIVFKTGAYAKRGEDSNLRRRGMGRNRELNAAALYSNPFADEHDIDMDEHDIIDRSQHLLAPGHDQVMSNNYSATTRDPDKEAPPCTLSPEPTRPVADVLFDLNEPPLEAQENTSVFVPSSATMERDLDQDEYVTAGQGSDAYTSIQAWAQSTNPNFYSPLPVSPPGPVSELEVTSEGSLTPTYSASIAGSGLDVGSDAVSSNAGENGRYDDVMSVEDDDVIPTPNSWSEVGSVISEQDNMVPA